MKKWYINNVNKISRYPLSLTNIYRSVLGILSLRSNDFYES